MNATTRSAVRSDGERPRAILGHQARLPQRPPAQRRRGQAGRAQERAHPLVERLLQRHLQVICRGPDYSGGQSGSDQGSKTWPVPVHPAPLLALIEYLELTPHRRDWKAHLFQPVRANVCTTRLDDRRERRRDDSPTFRVSY